MRRVITVRKLTIQFDAEDLTGPKRAVAESMVSCVGDKIRDLPGNPSIFIDEEDGEVESETRYDDGTALDEDDEDE